MLGLIPARGGSKTVPGKNIRDLCGEPLISYTIKCALAAEEIERVIVSTDSEEIAEVAVKYGAEVPFLRPSELAEDGTPDKPVLVHVIEWLKAEEKYQPEAVLLLRPTTPFKTVEIVTSVIELFEKTNADSVRTVTRVDGVHHPYWMYREGEEKRALPFSEGITIDKYFQRQLLPPVYRLNGVVDCIRTDILNRSGSLYGSDQRILKINALNSVDVDTELDFLYCETLLNSNSVKI